MTGTQQTNKSAMDVFQGKLITHDEVPVLSQQLIWTVLKTDKAIAEKTMNILDKEPEALNKGVGFPYVIVPVPSISEENITMRKKELSVAFACSVYSIQTHTLREMVGLVRSAVRKNIPILGQLRLEHVTTNSDNMGAYELDDGRIAYCINMDITFRAVVQKYSDD